jgi:hypothetical protein
MKKEPVCEVATASIRSLARTNFRHFDLSRSYSLTQIMDPVADGVYFSTAGVASVRWDQTAQLVLVEWDGWADSDEFAAVLAAEVEALKQHHGSRLLADCRRQKVLKPADQDRADQEWLPQALAAGLKRFAVVVPGSVLAEMNIRDRLSKVAVGKFEVEYFASVAEAREWLAR